MDEADLDERAYVRYTFPAKPSWDMDVAVFVTNRWHGTIVSCEEITPEWFPIAEVPLDRMWDDARYWQPQVLAGDWTDGELLDVDIVFNDDCLTVASSTITRRARAHS